MDSLQTLLQAPEFKPLAELLGISPLNQYECKKFFFNFYFLGLTRSPELWQTIEPLITILLTTGFSLSELVSIGFDPTLILACVEFNADDQEMGDAVEVVEVQDPNLSNHHQTLRPDSDSTASDSTEPETVEANWKSLETTKIVEKRRGFITERPKSFVIDLDAEDALLKAKQGLPFTN